ncbi:MAG: hypothetical protein ACYC3I_07485 [Gemmataceae bacterium]
MKTFVSSLLLLAILAVSGAYFCRAADRPPSLSKGRVLIFKNEHTMEGDIELVGDRYHVRRQVGESWIPADRVLGLAASLPDAYVYLRGRMNLDDPDERLRLARWCRDNGLQQQALAELQAANDLRPDHAETRRLLYYWKQAAATHVPPRGTATKGSPQSHPPENDPAPLEVTTESLGLFASRVQPILMNTCARCHATGHGGKFHLSQVYEDSVGSRRTLERNLAAVLAEVNVNQPETSRLLIKAVSDHAHAGQAPLRDRQTPAYRTLENWVKRTVADNPHLLDKSEIRNPKSETASAPMEEARPKVGEESQWGADARPSTVPSSSVAPADKGKAAPPTSPSASIDPYDPEPFNRKMHPEANKPQPGK